jgi:cytochrome o ubiquinol oxidase subunit 2
MIYAMPGMVSQLNLQADRPAVMFGQSGHFSGDGFSDMQFQVRSVPAAQFQAWTESVRTSTQILDRAAYVQLARQSQNVKPFGYSTVDSQLFHGIATQQIPPGPGPEIPGPAGRPAGGHD